MKKYDNTPLTEAQKKFISSFPMRQTPEQMAQQLTELEHSLKCAKEDCEHLDSAKSKVLLENRDLRNRIAVLESNSAALVKACEKLRDDLLLRGYSGPDGTRVVDVSWLIWAKFKDAIEKTKGLNEEDWGVTPKKTNTG